MLDILFHSFSDALMITVLVSMMMVIVEHLNIVFRGRLSALMARHPLGQSTAAGVLGVTPGCLGAFANVTLYEHGVLSFGALVAGMIATFGDEAFIMLSLVPKTFLAIAALLLPIGIVVGVVIDKVCARRFVSLTVKSCDELAVHDRVDTKRPRRPLAAIVDNFSGPNVARWAMLVLFLSYMVLIASGLIGHEDEEVWLRAMLMVAAAVCVAITLFGSEHFIKEHVWGHVIRRHVPRIFLWTLAALFVFEVVSVRLDVPQLVEHNRFVMLVIACLIGIIPQSGPHFIFVAMYANGALPFSILLANCIVQDGHGMLPLLAFSRRDFALVKAINLIVGLIVGAIALAIEIHLRG